MNLCEQTDEQRQLAAVDTEVCLWLMLLRNCKVSMGQILSVLSNMPAEQRELYRSRLNQCRPRFKGEDSLKHYSESTWGRLIASFEKQTARFNG